MALTAEVKDELARLPLGKTCCRKAEVATMLRVGGSLQVIQGEIVIEAEFDTSAIARRILGHQRAVRPRGAAVGDPTHRPAPRYQVRHPGDPRWSLAGPPDRLVDGRGRPVRGLPPAVVAGGACDAEAAWRGLPRPRLTHRTGTVIVAGDHLPEQRDSARTGRLRPALGDRRQSP